MLNEIRSALARFPECSQVEVERDSFEGEATRLLAGKLFHVTAAHNVPAVATAGAILPNLNGRFRPSFSGSHKSYGR